MTHLLLALLFSAVTLLAGDITGKWSGTMTTGEEPHPALLDLKQEGTTVTGTAGPDDGERYPIRDGKVEDKRVTFKVDAGEHGLIGVTLTLDGDDHLSGEAMADHDGEHRTAKLDLRREK